MVYWNHSTLLKHIIKKTNQTSSTIDQQSTLETPWTKRVFRTLRRHSKIFSELLTLPIKLIPKHFTTIIHHCFRSPNINKERTCFKHVVYLISHNNEQAKHILNRWMFPCFRTQNILKTSLKLTHKSLQNHSKISPKCSQKPSKRLPKPSQNAPKWDPRTPSGAVLQKSLPFWQFWCHFGAHLGAHFAHFGHLFR